MTIERGEGLVEMHCDECGVESFGPEAITDIEILRDEAKLQGWRTFESGCEWKNACPGCVAAFAGSQQGGSLL